MESPTGTGKTLCLLTASLAWLYQFRKEQASESESLARIIYCSRTHSQISQVANELKHTAYQPKMCLIGSRDQLCVNPNFKDLKGMSLTASCKKARETRRGKSGCCEYYKNVQDSLTPNAFPWTQAQDIEDLHRIGKSHKVCPYFLQKNRVEFADLILMPYNYLIDPKIRENFKIDYSNSIIIFDEAHNIEKVAEDVASFEISINMFSIILGELSNLLSSIEHSNLVEQNAVSNGA